MVLSRQPVVLLLLLLLLLISRLHTTSTAAPTPLTTAPPESAYFSCTTTRVLKSTRADDQQQQQQIEDQAITACIVSVQFYRDVHVVRDAASSTTTTSSSSSVLFDADIYPDVVDTTYGLTQVTCNVSDNSTLVFSTDHKVPPRTSPLPTGMLFPLIEIEQHSVSWLAASIALESFSASRAAIRATTKESSIDSSAASTYEAVYLHPNHAQDRTHAERNHPSRSTDIMSLVKANACQIKFLSKAQQTWIPKGSLVSFVDDGDVLGGKKRTAPIVGSIAVQYWDVENSAFSSLPASTPSSWPRRTLVGSSSASAVAQAFAAVAPPLVSSRKERRKRRRSGAKSSSSSSTKAGDCVPLPPGLAEYANGAVFLETMSKSTSKVHGIAEDLPDLIKMPVSDILKPITKLMGGFLGETLVEPFKEQMGQLTSAGMTSQIVEGLSSAMINSLSKGIPATTLETIPCESMEEFCFFFGFASFC